MKPNAFWQHELENARELVEHAKGNDVAFVGVQGAKAKLEVDEHVRKCEDMLSFFRADFHAHINIMPHPHPERTPIDIVRMIDDLIGPPPIS